MNMDYLKNITLFSNEMQKPFKDIMALNVKTMQGVKHLRLDELTDLRHPEEFLEKQVNVAIQNSHNMLDYMQKTFQIFESAFLNLSQDFAANSEKIMRVSGEDFLNSRKEFAQAVTAVSKAATAVTKKPVRKAVSANKKTATAKKAGSANKKTATAKKAGSANKKTVTAKKAGSANKKTVTAKKAVSANKKTATAKKTLGAHKTATAKKAVGSNKKAVTANKRIMTAATKSTTKSKAGTKSKMVRPIKSAHSNKRSSKKV